MSAKPLCPKTGAPMHRGVRPMILSYEGRSISIDMPGWYCDDCEESIHTGQDMEISDRIMDHLKALSPGKGDKMQVESFK